MTLRMDVYRMLAQGRTVAEVCATLAVPRLAVQRLARETGLRPVLGQDRYATTATAPRPTSAGELIRRGQACANAATATLAARVRRELAELERRVLTEEAAAAARSYPVPVVRAWARAEGIAVPDRGRWLPADVVQAWRLAGEPVVTS